MFTLCRLFIFFCISFKAYSCDKLLKISFDGIPIGEEFRVIKTHLKGEKQLAFILNQKSKKKSKKQHKKIYLELIHKFDSLAQRGLCKETYDRLFFIYPGISYTIATKEILKTRKYKKIPDKWNSHILIRSQVAYDKG